MVQAAERTPGCMCRGGWPEALVRTFAIVTGQISEFLNIFSKLYDFFVSAKSILEIATFKNNISKLTKETDFQKLLILLEILKFS